MNIFLLYDFNESINFGLIFIFTFTHAFILVGSLNLQRTLNICILLCSHRLTIASSVRRDYAFSLFGIKTSSPASAVGYAKFKWIQYFMDIDIL